MNLNSNVEILYRGRILTTVKFYIEINELHSGGEPSTSRADDRNRYSTELTDSVGLKTVTKAGGMFQSLHP